MVNARMMMKFLLLILERKKRRKALKELMPLLAYPIIFCIILVPPLFARTYDVFVTVKSKNDSIADITSFSLSGAVFIPMWSLLPGLALIAHICVLKWPKRCLSSTEISPLHYWLKSKG